ncbi:sigma-70 family RNA polymerase sigma factor [Bacillus spizizenii]|nr:sigma-70 family RNA polymerase sigma factor [Bacillus spizizenii]MCY8907090.1 sigma-70 family RNA polymerase sigma factor [Bacillus spizizenii]
MNDLLLSYKKTLEDTQWMRDQLKEIPGDEMTSKQAEDFKVISKIISDLEWTIEFLELGREPGLRRPINRRDKWARLSIQDSKMMEIYSTDRAVVPKADGEVTEEERALLESALAVLTNREREIYVMHEGEKLSYERICALLGVRKSTVQTTVKRARIKIEKYLLSRKEEHGEAVAI